jgi:hypothetical protein
MYTSHASLVDRITSRWWFYLLLVVAMFFPVYSAQQLNPQDTPKLVIEVLAYATIYSVPFFFPFFKLIPLVLIVLLFLRPQRFTRFFYAWAAFNLLLIAIFQNMANTPTYGFAVLVGNVVMAMIVSLMFGRAALRAQEPLRFERLPWWRYWVVPLALLAFWYPVNTSLIPPAPDFSLAGLLFNEAGLTFCMMLPVYLAVLTLASPVVDAPLLRVTGFIGTIIGLLNIWEFLMMSATYGWWEAIVHLPLLSISLYTFILGIRRATNPLPVDAVVSS